MLHFVPFRTFNSTVRICRYTKKRINLTVSRGQGVFSCFSLFWCRDFPYYNSRRLSSHVLFFYITLGVKRLNYRDPIHQPTPPFHFTSLSIHHPRCSIKDHSRVRLPCTTSVSPIEKDGNLFSLYFIFISTSLHGVLVSSRLGCLFGRTSTFPPDIFPHRNTGRHRRTVVRPTP